MIEKALTAKLPLIKIQTDDLINIHKILESYTEQKIKILAEGDRVSGYSYYCMISPVEVDYQLFYKLAIEANITIIIINSEDNDNGICFDAGVVTLPKYMLYEFLNKILDETIIYNVANTLKDMSLKNVAEIISMSCGEDDGCVTLENINLIKKNFMQPPIGVLEVNTNIPFYKAKKTLNDWLKNCAPLLTLNNIPTVLKPRGLLFSGASGCGKTTGAKYIAKEIKLPLFLLDINSLLNKYVGESQTNLNNALKYFESIAPCVILLDEVDKLFLRDESGVGNNLLAQLLWWLQEHNANILTIMTTNDIKKIPEELYRPGRIDNEINFTELVGPKNIIDFVVALLHILKVNKRKIKHFRDLICINELDIKNSHFKGASHAKITQITYNIIGQYYGKLLSGN